MLSLKLPKLLNINQVPKVFREQGIVFGYRHPRSSAADCLLSVFQMTNETLNIWTHFVPAWYLPCFLSDAALRYSYQPSSIRGNRRWVDNPSGVGGGRGRGRWHRGESRAALTASSKKSAREPRLQ
uniref:Uncharacterized protein n=1 Tax=Crocodylus porosus TaxID=8502 RepID=A0A7M4DXI3_CROPO